MRILAVTIGMVTHNPHEFPGRFFVGPVVMKAIAALRQAVREARLRQLTIGLVPTMGALHAGHASLIRAARRQTGFVVVSIFVNPLQFGPHEDFARYPRPFEKDVALCAAEGADLIFAPEVDTLFPTGFRTTVEVGGLQDVLCGASRPGHFRGVATVVLKLFNLVTPDRAYFGQKDAQQVRIIRQMAADLDLPVEVCACPIVREADGLALSSRNIYLDAQQRKHAAVLFRSLEEARARIERGERSAMVLQGALTERITATPGAILDYAAVVDAETLQPLDPLRGQVLLALAVKFGATRLIDNLLVHVP
jgi:pantoate--beta-alanine ligase